MADKDNIRNICVIAHVDHGKTTLVDALLKDSGAFRDNASITWKGVKINIVDTPGHQDFGGEVERILKMVDGALLLVDAVDGPMPQTKFVLRKSLELGLCPMVVVNKIDRPDARPSWVVDQVFDLFAALGASDEQLDFHIIYSSAKLGFASADYTDEGRDMAPLLDAIVEKVAPPMVDDKGHFQMLITSAEYSDYLGRMAVGKINRGVVKSGGQLARIDLNGNITEGQVVKLFSYEGLGKKEIESASAGEIAVIAGFKALEIGETLADKDMPEPLPAVEIDAPTISMNFSINSSPFAGKSGDKVTARHLADRLYNELKSNLALKVEKDTDGESFSVFGRGELHLSILVETMRREGYELSVSRPHVITVEKDGKRMEPEEFVIIDVDENFSGRVIEIFGRKKGELKNMAPATEGIIRFEFTIPVRGLLGIHGELLTETRGTAVMTHTFHNYIPWAGPIPSRQNGVLISMDNGTASAYALDKLSDRGTLFIGPGTEVYKGMIVGERNRSTDIVVNVCKGKKLTNTRAAGSDDMIKLAPPRKLSLEQSLEFVNDDELVEVTPGYIRLRKRYLDEETRKSHRKRSAFAQSA